MTRLERFRKYVAAMDPTSPLDREHGETLYVDSEPRKSLIKAICTRVELAPNRRLLVVGCTGSGKTTLVQRCIRQIRDTFIATNDFAAYVDVSRAHRLDGEKLEGVLVAIAGERLLSRSRELIPRPEYLEAKEALQRHARGYDEWVDITSEDENEDEPYGDDGSDGSGYYVHRKGVLSPPRNPLQPKVYSDLVGPLTVLREAAVGKEGHAIFSFDSLDRLSKPGRFSEAVKHDLPVLGAAGIGTIVVGPVRYALGSDRSVHELFDAVHVVPTIDTRDPEGRDFLLRVLRARDRGGVLADQILPKLLHASGGVLRDLLSLAQRSGEEAYARGRDPVTAEDVDAAISALGDSLAFGIDDADLRVLRTLQQTGEFVIRGEAELALVDQRRVLNIGPAAWAIHPALLPKLGAIPKEAA